MKIISSSMFSGNLIERNKIRISSINKLSENDDLKNILERLKLACINDDILLFKDIVLNELFFEEINSIILDKYIKKIYCKNIDTNKFIEIYKKHATRGFLYFVNEFIK